VRQTVKNAIVKMRVSGSQKENDSTFSSLDHGTLPLSSIPRLRWKAKVDIFHPPIAAANRSILLVVISNVQSFPPQVMRQML
jgi:hypothetical protein